VRIRLRLRVVVLVTVFNLAVFGGGLAWFTTRLSSERAQNAGIDEDLVLERLNKVLGAEGKGVAGEILDWERWSHYEDALVVQLGKSAAAARWGLFEDLDRVAREDRPSWVPRGAVLPMRVPQRRGRTFIDLPPPPLDRLWVVSLAPPLAFRVPPVPVAIPRLSAPREVWGACFVPQPPARFWRLWRYALDLPNQLVFLGLSPQRQRGYDAWLERHAYLHRALRESAEGGRPVEIGGGALWPMENVTGEVWGAAYLPFRRWDPTGLFPWRWFEGNVWPWRLFTGATLVGLPEMGFPPALDVSGLLLNPMGAAHRPATFEVSAVVSDLTRAARAGARLETPRGLAVPLHLAGGDLWGGVWLKPRPLPGAAALLAELLPWFFLSTALLTLATFFGIRSLVLNPVRRLARGARRLAGGDLGTRIPETSRSDELSELVRSFNAMAAEVEGFNARLAHEVEIATAQAREAEAAAMTQRRLAATGELAAGIAHEINNPLGGLLNALSVLRRQELDPAKHARYLELLEGGLEQIGRIAGGMLRLAPRDTRVEPVSLAGPIEDTVGLLRHRVETVGARLVLEGAGGERPLDTPDAFAPWRELPQVSGQANELGQAVLNLLGNALDAIEEGGSEVRIGLERRGASLLLWIVDDGPGMDPELLPRAADLFFTTKDTGRGTGLGLAVVHNIVNGHGGAVRMANRPEGGMRVEVELPLAEGSGPR